VRESLLFRREIVGSGMEILKGLGSGIVVN
jgi:hypothetical protein